MAPITILDLPCVFLILPVDSGNFGSCCRQGYNSVIILNDGKGREEPTIYNLTLYFPASLIKR